MDIKLLIMFFKTRIDEDLAIEATKTVLLELLRKDDDFYDKSLSDQRNIMKKTMIKQSIAVMRSAFNYHERTD